MIDFHSHVLPQMDDGSHSVAESVQMLQKLHSQGIDTVVATPHFYAEDNSPQVFLQRREQAYEQLKTADIQNLPAIHLGAEACYYEGISRSDNLESLCIEGTRVLLLEMPFVVWNRRILQEAEELIHQRHLQVVLAHIERYLPNQPPDILQEIFSGDFLLQSNCSFFLRWQTRRKAMGMLQRGEIHLLGSDCHGSEYRPPRMAEAMDMIHKKMGLQALYRLEEQARFLLGNGQ